MSGLSRNMSTLKFHPQGTPWSPEWKADALLIYDRALEGKGSMRPWIRRFPSRYAVRAGEELKDVRAFPHHVEKILRLAENIPHRRLKIVAMGGGSVGDFAGFLASIFKRGVSLVHVPTTWLAALDSAHGGKNGLNAAGIKNQLGTIYQASEVHLVKKFLMAQPEDRAFEAAGEFLKMALLKGGRLARQPWKTESSADSLWAALPAVVKAKMSIVRRDPLEKSGVRHLLNLGHTMGHLFESDLGLPHGVAVGYGLVFAGVFSRAQGLCGEKAYDRMISHPLWGLYMPSEVYQRCLSIPPSRVRRLLLQDKKRTSKSGVRFIFLAGLGKPLIREVSVEAILAEVGRQKAMLKVWHA